MSLIDWNIGLITGVELIDQQHEHLIGLLNSTHYARIGGSSRESLASLLDELIDYATYHFATEERYMQENRYPELENHAMEHEKFSARVVAFQNDFAAGNVDLTLDVLLFLKNWLTNHIMETDKEMGAYLNSV